MEEETFFLSVWTRIETRYFLKGVPNISKTGAKEAYEFLYRISPFLAKNIPFAASWVTKAANLGPDFLGDTLQAKALTQVELLHRAGELIEDLKDKATSE